MTATVITDTRSLICRLSTGASTPIVVGAGELFLGLVINIDTLKISNRIVVTRCACFNCLNMGFQFANLRPNLLTVLIHSFSLLVVASSECSAKDLVATLER